MAAPVVDSNSISRVTTPKQNIELAQFSFGGHNYCWYDSAWSGPGWYWCGYAQRRGFGFGGRAGFHGWHHGGHGGRGGHGHVGGHRGGHPGGHPGGHGGGHSGGHPGGGGHGGGGGQGGPK